MQSTNHRYFQYNLVMTEEQHEELRASHLQKDFIANSFPVQIDITTKLKVLDQIGTISQAINAIGYQGYHLKADLQSARHFSESKFHSHTHSEFQSYSPSKKNKVIGIGSSGVLSISLHLGHIIQKYRLLRYGLLKLYNFFKQRRTQQDKNKKVCQYLFSRGIKRWRDFTQNSRGYKQVRESIERKFWKTWKRTMVAKKHKCKILHHYLLVLNQTYRRNVYTRVWEKAWGSKIRFVWSKWTALAIGFNNKIAMCQKIRRISMLRTNFKMMKSILFADKLKVQTFRKHGIRILIHNIKRRKKERQLDEKVLRWIVPNSWKFMSSFISTILLQKMQGKVGLFFYIRMGMIRSFHKLYCLAMKRKVNAKGRKGLAYNKNYSRMVDFLYQAIGKVRNDAIYIKRWSYLSYRKNPLPATEIDIVMKTFGVPVYNHNSSSSSSSSSSSRVLQEDIAIDDVEEDYYSIQEDAQELNRPVNTAAIKYCESIHPEVVYMKHALRKWIKHLQDIKLAYFKMDKTIIPYSDANQLQRCFAYLKVCAQQQKVKRKLRRCQFSKHFFTKFVVLLSKKTELQQVVKFSDAYFQICSMKKCMMQFKKYRRQRQHALSNAETANFFNYSRKVEYFIIRLKSLN